MRSKRRKLSNLLTNKKHPPPTPKKIAELTCAICVFMSIYEVCLLVA